MSNSSSVGLAYVAETVWGTTPASALKTLRYTGEDLAESIETKASDEIRADRMVSDLMRVGFGAGGGFSFELSMETFDDFLAAALCGAWSSDILKNGLLEKSFTLEKKFADKTLFQTFRGMVLNNLSLAIASRAVVTGRMYFIGKDAITAAVTAGTGAQVAATTTNNMTASANVAGLKEGGSAMTGVYLKSINLNIANNMRGKDAVGQQALVGVGQGQFSVTGTMEAYFDSWALYEKFKNGTATSLEFQLVDGTKGYTFLLPNLKFSDAKVNAAGNNQDVMLPLSFQALYDSTEACMLKITRDLT